MIEKLNNSIKHKANIGKSGKVTGSPLLDAMPAPIPYNQDRGFHHVSQN
jgi:hypothetical protein